MRSATDQSSFSSNDSTNSIYVYVTFRVALVIKSFFLNSCLHYLMNRSAFSAAPLAPGIAHRSRPPKCSFQSGMLIVRPGNLFQFRMRTALPTANLYRAVPSREFIAILSGQPFRRLIRAGAITVAILIGSYRMKYRKSAASFVCAPRRRPSRVSIHSLS